jgi:hypothetical protein
MGESTGPFPWLPVVAAVVVVVGVLALAVAIWAP